MYTHIKTAMNYAFGHESNALGKSLAVNIYFVTNALKTFTDKK